jgi:hypothetical protein
MSGSQTAFADFEVSSSKTVSAPILSLLPSPFDFGTVQTGTTSTKTVQLSNTGDTTGGNLIVSGASVDNPLFNIPNSQFPMTVPPGSSVPLTITFSPQANGAVTGTVSFTSNASNPTVTLSLTAIGGATTSAGALNISPTSLFFGNVIVGATQTQTVTMSNPGTGSTTVSAGTVSGSGFAIVSPVFPLVLAAGTSQVVTISFTPPSSGSVTGVITFASDAASTPVVSLIASGNASSPVTSATAFPTTIDFGLVPLGLTYTSTVVVYNTGNQTLSVTSASVAGAGFGIDASAYPVTIPVNASQAFTIAFTAFTAGTSSGTVTFPTNATTGNPVVGVTGTGAFASVHSAALTWNASPSSVIGYNVYRSTTPNTGYQKLTFTQLTNFTDSTVASGTTYYYVVTAVAANGLESVNSNQASAQIP